VLKRDTPLSVPSNHTLRRGVKNTPTTFANIALKIAVAIFAPADKV
jgi:hypothetical protein